MDTPLTIAGRTFRSRLMVGTGKYRTNEEMLAAHEASGAEIVTVAVRRVDLDRSNKGGILHYLDPERQFLLANTAGCYTAEDAVRYARLAREAGFNEFVKLEVIGDEETLLPDVDGLLRAARTLVGEGFAVLAYTNDDLITALRLVDAGVGTATDACLVMEQGVDGILMKTALAEADDPAAMASAMRHAVEAGRLAYLAGRMARREVAVPSSPRAGMLA